MEERGSKCTLGSIFSDYSKAEIHSLRPVHPQPRKKGPRETAEAVLNRLCSLLGCSPSMPEPAMGVPCKEQESCSSVLGDFRLLASLPGCPACGVLGICSLHSLLLLPSEKQPLTRETSAFTQCCTTGNTGAISLPVLQECFYSATSVITGNTPMRQGVCSSPLSPSGSAAPAICPTADVTATPCASTAACWAVVWPGAWHPLEGQERVAQGSLRQI